MTYYEHTKTHDIDCDCSYCMDVDPNKSVSREIERCYETVIGIAHPNLTEADFNKVQDAFLRLNMLRSYLPVQELPHKFELRVEQAIKEARN